MKLLGVICLLVSMATASAAAERLRVLTTIPPVYSFVTQVAGTNAVVENLFTGPVDLHDHQLTPSELRRIKQADLIILVGLGLESFLEKPIKNAAPSGARKVRLVSQGMDEHLISDDAPHVHGDEEHDHSSEAYNPHIWLDPVLAIAAVRNVEKFLTQADPAQAQSYAANAANYIRRLEALHQEIQFKVARIKNRPFLTYHNAFPYFSRRYDLRLIGVVQTASEIAPSPRDVSRLLQVIRKEKVQALFVEPGDRAALARRIAQDARIRLGELDPLESGETSPDSYEKGMHRNLQTLLKTLD